MATTPGDPCPTCGHELVVIAMAVDHAQLEMASCQTCDTRLWRHRGEPIELADALAEVGEHSGRRR